MHLKISSVKLRLFCSGGDELKLSQVPVKQTLEYMGKYIPWIRPELSWWRHQMETFSALLALCAGNSPVTSEFPAQRPVTQSLDVFFDLRLNKQLSKVIWDAITIILT